MQVRFELMPMAIRAADNHFLAESLLQRFEQVYGDIFEMMQGVILYATLGVPTLVVGVTIVPLLTNRRGAKQSFPLLQLVQPQIEKSGLLTVDQRHPQRGLRAQHLAS